MFTAQAKRNVIIDKKIIWRNILPTRLFHAGVFKYELYRRRSLELDRVYVQVHLLVTSSVFAQNIDGFADALFEHDLVLEHNQKFGIFDL